MIVRSRAPALLLAIVLASTQAAALQAPQGQGSDTEAARLDLERRTSAIASELRCPVCQGVSVEDSPTDLAREMRAVVRDQLAAGRTPDEVRGYFVERYGEWILLKPRASGFNLIVYALPWLAVLAGMAVIVVAVRRWTRPELVAVEGEAPSGPSIPNPEP